MSEIELGYFPPGAVSAIYFFVLELFALGAIDIILIHVVSRLWHRDIKRGIALEVKSAEIPGVATSLVGQHLSPPNLFAYFVKFMALGIILLADLNIKTKVKDEERKIIFTGTFDFDTSVWGNGEERVVTRPSLHTKFCRFSDPLSETITYYRIRFNFTDNQVLENENSDFLASINTSSIICMRRGSVETFEQRRLEIINGCSSYQTSKCTNQTLVELPHRFYLPFDNQFPTTFLSFYVLQARRFLSYTITDYTSIAPDIFGYYNEGNYSSPTLSCMRYSFSSLLNNSNQEIVNACILTALVKREGEGTLIERWEYNEEKEAFFRLAPGPIFDRTLDISVAYKGIILRELGGFDSWESFSSLLIQKGLVYRKDINERLAPIDQFKPITVLPVYSVITVLVFLLVTIVTSVIVHLTIAKDDKPKINTINGISSVAREEMEPTGRSLNKGSPVSIGLSKRNGDESRFGTLRSEDFSTSYKDSKFIV